VHHNIEGSNVIVAIVGGTLLCLALTRPRPAWVSRLDPSPRRVIEFGMTIVAFVMSGYAYGCLYVVLHHQLSAEIDRLLRVAAFIFIIYALYVHFEPFSPAKARLELAFAVILYLALFLAAALIGVVIVEYTAHHKFSVGPVFIESIAVVLVASPSVVLVASPFYCLVRKQTATHPATDEPDPVISV
jgi:hypothetical protein